MAKCKCDFCKLSKRLQTIQKKLNKRDSNFLEGFVGHYLEVSQDADYRKALLDGTWPESEIIHKAYIEWKKNRF